MKKKNACMILVLFFSSSTMFLFITEKVKAESSTVVYVNPPTVVAIPVENFTININVANVKNLYTYQFRLSWEPSLLNVTSVTEGPFLNAKGTYMTSFTQKIYNTPDPLGVSGYVYAACTLLAEPATAAASGNGTLVTVEFQANKAGNTSLHLHDTMLISPLLEEMPHGTEDGYSTIISEFPSFLILPLFMIATLFAVIFYGRKHVM